MSLDRLINAPYFSKIEHDIKQGTKVLWATFIVSTIFFGIGIGQLMPWLAFGRQEGLVWSVILFLGGILLFLLALRAKKNVAKLKSDLEEEISGYFVSERLKLQALKDKMSVAEWENYKLQIQNNKLLEELNQKQNLKTRTTTTSWVAQVSDD